MKIVKPDKLKALRYDYELCVKNGIDWKAKYKRRQMLFGKECVEQGSMSDFEYYTKTHNLKFNYYLVSDDEHTVIFYLLW